MPPLLIVFLKKHILIERYICEKKSHKLSLHQWMLQDLVDLGGTQSTTKSVLNIKRDNSDRKENSLWTCLKLHRACGGIFHSLKLFLLHLLLYVNKLTDLYDTETQFLCLFFNEFGNFVKLIFYSTQKFLLKLMQIKEILLTLFSISFSFGEIA